MATQESVTVGRPRLFDEDVVLGELTGLFWRHGYAQTSMSQIVEISGMHKPSLYRAFGSKDELFARVLRRYLAERMGAFAAMIDSSGSGPEAVHRFLDLFETDAVSARGRDGCLMVMASNELRGHLHEYDFAADYREQMRACLSVLVARACGVDEAAAAGAEVVRTRTDLLTTYLLGMHVIMRSGAPASEIHDFLRALHQTVDLW
ncbi:helix-turn-helix domain-containing protein [Microbacterium sp. SSW1-59]|uniref:TetR/AcrR family transcriptional regulator n=1 Tax=Microbacterium xanthum TaxID=3079794 RepID=UPI002AD21497|nr:helix-turn-helix domain-containing protein [Microbacterium sp. SSW1-59]MDZ8200576.1 helix-turn-helix domain-containing protein [Microbacterium sp. SSW1-59]